jgi:ABC-2 type transport system permease protein
MSSITYLFSKELRSYFTSWLAYVLLAGWLFITGYIFALLVINSTKVPNFDLSPLFSNMMVFVLFITPLVTMRLLSEEKREGTIEMLFTSPLTEWQVTLGKFIGALLFMVVLVACTLYVPFFTFRYGSVDGGPIWGSYLALLLVCGSAVSFGVFCSSITDSQAVAGFLTFGGLLGSWILNWFFQAAPENKWAGLVSQFSLYTHFYGMLFGAIDTKDIFFFLTLIFFFLYATVRVLESRKWR